MVQQFLLHGILQIHVLIQEQMLLEQEEVMLFASRLVLLAVVCVRCVCVPILLPLGHDVCNLLFCY